jgi:hypothetical protein
MRRRIGEVGWSGEYGEVAQGRRAVASTQIAMDGASAAVENIAALSLSGIDGCAIECCSM